MSVEIAHDHEFEKKSSFCVMRGATGWVEGKNYFWYHSWLGKENNICQAPDVFQIYTEHYLFYSSRNPKWLGRYYSHFSDETESWSDSSIVTWLLQRQACIWSHIHLSGSYIQVFFIAPSSLLLLWLFLSCLLCLIFYFYTFNTKVT